MKKLWLNGMYNTDRRVFIPGTAWMMDWIFDPTGNREAAGKHVMFKMNDRDSILA